MKILYCESWHSSLDSDQLNGFSMLGHEWFSTGRYLDPKFPMKAKDSLRGPIQYEQDPDLIEEFRKLNPNHAEYKSINLSADFVDKFDLVCVNHCCPLPEGLFSLWPHIKHKPVIWRTYAQQSGEVEYHTKVLRDKHSNLTLVRVASTESRIPNFAGTDFVIKGYVDKDRFKDWNGFGGEILTFNNFFTKRTFVSNTQVYRRILNKIQHPASLYGCNNEDSSFSKGILSSDDQLKAYQNCGVYFALGSKPAALTYNFQEALMTGCPVVTFGPHLGGSSPNLYEVPEVVENGIDCYYADSENELEFYTRTLLTNENTAKALSKAGREKAIKLYSVEENLRLWAEAIEHSLGTV